MPSVLFLKSLLLGISVAAPIGPIGMMVLQRTMKLGLKKGLASGLGVALADMICAAAVSAGIAAILLQAGPLAWTLKLAGGVYLVGIGLRAWKAASDAAGEEADLKGEGALSILLLTLANPGTWIAYAGAYAAIQSDLGSGWGLDYVLGVGLGSGLWWCFLSFFAGWLRTKLDRGMKRVMYRISGAMIIFFGLWGVLQLS
jgi:threonine/homoserine/homoserine lactone efflux protein